MSRPSVCVLTCRTAGQVQRGGPYGEFYRPESASNTPQSWWNVSPNWFGEALCVIWGAVLRDSGGRGSPNRFGEALCVIWGAVLRDLGGRGSPNWFGEERGCRGGLVRGAGACGV